MDEQKFIIRGGKVLAGTVRVSGAKNAALKVLAASLLMRHPLEASNLPLVEDVLRTLELLEMVGAEVEKDATGLVRVSSPENADTVIAPEIAKRIRASMVLTGPMLSRYGKVSFPHPGGCVIGERPIDFFLRGYATLGASVEEADGMYHVRAPQGLKGGEIFFPNVSVTGTETLMMAATLANGTTRLNNAAMEPEIVWLADLLNVCGAKIRGHGTPFITIEGVDTLGGGRFKTIPDRIEAGSYALAAASTKSRVTVASCEPSHLDALWVMLRFAGVDVQKGDDTVIVDATHGKALRGQNVRTHEYPGFVTDLQAPTVVFLTQCEGKSLVHETIFEGRLAWTQDLVRMGAHIDIADPHRIFVNGPAKLRGREIETPDLRAGMAFIVAGLAAEGTTELHNIYQIDRGYERVEEKLQGLGADIERGTHADAVPLAVPAGVRSI